MLSLRLVLPADGLLALLLGLVFVVPRFAPRLKPPRFVYGAGALVAVCGWGVFWIATGVTSTFSGETVFGIAIEGSVGVCVFAASVLLPLEAGVLGWAAIRSRWRWALIAAGALVSFPPLLLLVAIFRMQ